MPLIAKLFAESPSVKINVHRDDYSEPARFASSSLGIPKRRYFFLPDWPSFFFNSIFYFASAKSIIASKIPLLATLFKNLSDSSHVEPNYPDLVVRVSLV